MTRREEKRRGRRESEQEGNEGRGWEAENLIVKHHLSAHVGMVVICLRQLSGGCSSLRPSLVVQVQPRHMEMGT